MQGHLMYKQYFNLDISNNIVCYTVGDYCMTQGVHHEGFTVHTIQEYTVH